MVGFFSNIMTMDYSSSAQGVISTGGKHNTMASGNLVEKQLLIEQLQQTAMAGESAFFSILTDLKRSVLLRFSKGKLIHIHCRRSGQSQAADADNAAIAINECQRLKFVRTQSGQPKDKPEVMPLELFLQSLKDDAVDSPPAAVEVAAVAVLTPELQAQFTEIARDYIGLVADILIADICREAQPVAATIEQIAAAMPAQAQADDFRQRALALTAT